MAVFGTSTSVVTGTSVITDDSYGGTVVLWPDSTVYPADPIGMFPDTIRLQTTALRYEWITQPSWSRRQMPTEADLDTYWSSAQSHLRAAGHKVFDNTTERDTIVTSPVEGEMVYIVNVHETQVWDGSAWRVIPRLNGEEFILDSSVLDGGDILA